MSIVCNAYDKQGKNTGIVEGGIWSLCFSSFDIRLAERAVKCPAPFLHLHGMSLTQFGTTRLWKVWIYTNLLSRVLCPSNVFPQVTALLLLITHTHIYNYTTVF